MKSTIKFLMISLGLVLILTGLVSIVAASRLEVGKRALENALTYSFGAKTHIDSMTFSPLKEALEIYGLRVDNPPNFLPGTAVECGRMLVSFDLRSLLKDTPSIRLVKIDDASLNLRHEMGHGANLAKLVQSAAHHIQGSTHTDGGGKRTFSIERLEVNGSKLEMSSNAVPSRDVSVDLAPIEVDNVSAGKPVSAGEAGGVILEQILHQSLTVHNVVSPLAAGLRTALQRLQEAFGSGGSTRIDSSKSAPVP